MNDRRRVLQVIAGCSSAALAAVGVVPSVALVAEPGRSAGGGPDPWLRVARVDALEVGRPHKAPVVGPDVDAWIHAAAHRLGGVWLIRDTDTAVRAYSVTCPHLGCAIDLAGDHFDCPCHDSRFDLQGRTQSGPSPRGMDPLDVRVADGWVNVRFRRFRTGSAERLPG